MGNKFFGYYGVILEIDLTKGTYEKKAIPFEDLEMYIGGRGLGMKILWDHLSEPGVDPLAPENPLIIMTSPLSGFPVPAVSMVNFVTKSPHTSPDQSDYSNASTLTYSNMGGFLGPEIKFAGYDGIVITGKASSPVYIVINNDMIDIRDASKFWGMNTDEFDKVFTEELGDRKQRYSTCYIGQAGENMVKYASIVSTTARVSGRGGTGCVMGSKNLKAIAVRGSNMPEVYDHERFLDLLETSRKRFPPIVKKITETFGSLSSLGTASMMGLETVKNFREATFLNVWKIGPIASLKKIWVRDFSCFCCPLACKKSGVVRDGPYAGVSHDGPEYETAVMLGSNLLISDLNGLVKEIFTSDDYGIDMISTGNVIGFLMEAYDKKYIDKNFLDGIDLKWGSVDAALAMIEKIAKRDGIGDICSRGVKALAKEIGQDSYKFAIHVKGQEAAGWNVHPDPSVGISYITSNRGACHLNGNDIDIQNHKVFCDSLCFCARGSVGMKDSLLSKLFSAITGIERTTEEFTRASERIFNLEKMFNYREGFRRADDSLPDRFFEEPLTIGINRGAVLDREKFSSRLDDYYKDRGWDIKTSKPTQSRLKSLGLSFTLE